MTFTINADFLKRWWPLAVPVLTDLWHVWKPHLSLVVINHPNATIWVASLSIVVAYVLKSPITSQQNGSNPASTNSVLDSAVAAARKKATGK